VKRREFLRTTVVAAVPLVTGCASGRSNSNPDSNTDDDSQADDSLRFDEELFPQSVASGDPRPGSVVLWTRLREGADDVLGLNLELATDETFEHRLELEGVPPELRAERRSDYCVRVRVVGLSPDTTYYYRFVHKNADGRFRSRTGRTQTAPSEDSDRAVRFAVMSCQDYGGRYYHVLEHAAGEDVDFVVHLGDYIYETTSDPSFQSDDEARRIVFTDADGALQLGRGPAPAAAEGLATPDAGAATPPRFFAARSLDNYRELYRTVRTDRKLQRVHERFPMICVWDDHEFSNDSFGQTATYEEGRTDEKDPERRANADQAWVEYMPVDYDDDADAPFEFDRCRPFPDSLKIYREFRFGRHLQLVMTDLRRFRVDHIVPEDAFPGTVATPEQRLVELLGEVPAVAEPYVDIDAFAGGAYRTQLSDAIHVGFELGFDPDRLKGQLHVGFVNALVERYNAVADTQLYAIDPGDATLERGIAWIQLGKSEEFTSFGSRMFVVDETFRLVALDRYEATDGESERVMGDAQQRWFVDTLNGSDATWKVWGNSYTLSTRAVDLTSLTLPDPSLAKRFRLSTDDWDGVPNRRAALLSELAAVQNLVAVTGDSHSFFASDTGVPGADHVLEFVCGAVSSATYQAVLQSGAAEAAGVGALAPLAGALIAQASPNVAYQNVSDNGYGVVVVDADAMYVTFHQIAHDDLLQKHLEGDFERHFTQRHFRVRSGTASIEQLLDGEFRRWDKHKREYV
jgi:alkaline phosphatase D